MEEVVFADFSFEVKGDREEERNFFVEHFDREFIDDEDFNSFLGKREKN